MNAVYLHARRYLGSNLDQATDCHHTSRQQAHTHTSPLHIPNSTHRSGSSPNLTQRYLTSPGKTESFKSKDQPSMPRSVYALYWQVLLVSQQGIHPSGLFSVNIWSLPLVKGQLFTTCAHLPIATSVMAELSTRWGQEAQLNCLRLGTTWSWANITPRPLYHQDRNPTPIVKDAAWTPSKGFGENINALSLPGFEPHILQLEDSAIPAPNTGTTH
jgi:hypothetical protein